jgi:hypothetical protein
MRRSRLLIASLLIGAVVQVMATRAEGCECGRRRDPAAEFEKSVLVFRGTVANIEDRLASGLWWVAHFGVRATDSCYEKCFGIAVTFTVQGSWRGTPGPSVLVLTGQGGGDCGYRFEPGEEYLVYAYRGLDGAPATDICRRTRPVSAAAADLAFLRQGSEPK